MFDDTGDGIISSGVLKKVFRILDPSGWPDAKLDPLLEALDTSGSGGIQYEAFVAWIASADVASHEPLAGMNNELLTTIQRQRSLGPGILDSPLLNMPLASELSKESLLKEALTDDAKGSLVEPESFVNVTEDQIRMTIQRSCSMGPSILDTPLLQMSPSVAADSEKFLLESAMEPEPQTEPPTRRPSLEPPPEEDAGIDDIPEAELLSTIQRSWSQGPSAIDADLAPDAAAETEESALLGALESEPPTRPQSPELLPAVTEETSGDLSPVQSF